MNDMPSICILSVSYTHRDVYKRQPLNGPAIGSNFRFSLSPISFINKAVNNLNLFTDAGYVAEIYEY